MKKIDIGKITEFSNFNNGNDGITLYKKNKLNMQYYEFTKDGVHVGFDVPSMRNITYTTRIYIVNNTVLNEFYCSCTYRNTKNDVCKHIVASYIFFLNELKDNIKPTLIYDFSQLDKLTTLNEKDILNNADTDYFKVDYFLYLNDIDNILLEIKLISNKTYSISNISEFLNSILSSSPYPINKNTSLNISINSFNEKDRAFLSKLLTIYSLIKINAIIVDNIFFNQYIKLNYYLFENLVDSLDENNLHIKFKHTLFDCCKIIKDDLDISPIISTDNNNNITLSLKTLNIIELFSGKHYFYHDGSIFNTSSSFIKTYNCIKKLVLDNNTSYFTINDDNKNVFLNQIIPKLSLNFNLKISESLSNIISIEECKCKFYIDKVSNDIVIIKVVFRYGNLDINPLDINSLNISILRDYGVENKVLTSLNKLTEYKNSIYYVIKSPDKIIDFKENGISILKNLGEVYYTKKFKQYKLIHSSSYKTSFSIGLNNLLNISFSFDGITNEELYSAIKNIRKGSKYLKLKDKGILNLDNDYLKEINSILKDLNIDEKELKNDSLNIDKYYAFYINDAYSNNFKSIGELNKSENFLKITDDLSNISNIDLSPPKNLNASLRNYQLEGFKWIKTLKEYNLSGILADEMGLGKTLQTIAFLQKEYENNSLGNAIIICPKSLIYNWFDEIKKFAPELKVLIFNGNKNIRSKLLDEFQNYDIILTSYGIIQKDIDVLKLKNFNICIIDEAQNIKNKSSKNTISLKELNVNYKFALTGTPIENSIEELWSIFNFLMPGYLYSYSKFRSIYGDQENYSSSNLNKKISPFILRRLKKNVLTELPPKIETKIMIDLNNEQKKLYYSYINKFKEEFGFENENLNDKNIKFKMLSALTRLRQICCDPKVIFEDYSHGSSKIDTLMDIIDEYIKNNKKIIIFSNFTTVLKIIRDKFIKNNIKYTYLDGSVPSKDRIDIVNDFNQNDYNIFLISLKAGGFGLNITSAEIVIHFDPWWNNAVEDQATDRAHRIGQKNTIHVIKLITKGTIEEKIFEIQERKNILINSIIKDSELEYSSISKMSVEDLKNLFTIDTL
ncbi:DEAD/DEAH box helicase [Candidatus Arthromitus sp. SFB-rat-Yit]|uniref:DEAD/DEAH box helicase n=1 Tax=Candidatus Arthromitus sp. SFB-rat-Yit TaxID=1041504 RepID=UPI000227A704|nr:DEAD/DEAH box helicase [Candidatus Arthromitus sp. SFB-rat-Yit]BAK81723.1 putative helicase [Candidatus Arthromitus sp. SFB-rat-Yit]